MKFHASRVAQAFIGEYRYEAVGSWFMLTAGGLICWLRPDRTVPRAFTIPSLSVSAPFFCIFHKVPAQDTKLRETEKKQACTPMFHIACFCMPPMGPSPSSSTGSVCILNSGVQSQRLVGSGP